MHCGPVVHVLQEQAPVFVSHAALAAPMEEHPQATQASLHIGIWTPREIGRREHWHSLRLVVIVMNELNHWETKVMEIYKVPGDRFIPCGSRGGGRVFEEFPAASLAVVSVRVVLTGNACATITLQHIHKVVKILVLDKVRVGIIKVMCLCVMILPSFEMLAPRPRRACRRM